MIKFKNVKLQPAMANTIKRVLERVEATTGADITVYPKKVVYRHPDGFETVRHYRDSYTLYVVCATIEEYTIPGGVMPMLDSYPGR